MRAVNLIPAPERRTGLRVEGINTSYAVIGALAAILVAVLAVAVTSKQISDRKSEVAGLEQQEREATARAASLRAFSDFRTLQEQRTQTVSSLAKSRFDWERVMRELALVLPDDVWLVKLAGTVNSEVQLDEGVSLSARANVAGPALEIVGCAPGQESVAAIVSALEDIDGVTRVGVQSSEKPESTTAGGSGSGSGSGASDECRTRDFISKFELVVAFDAAPSAAGSAPSSQQPAAPAPQGSVQEQTEKAENATNYVPGN